MNTSSTNVNSVSIDSDCSNNKFYRSTSLNNKIIKNRLNEIINVEKAKDDITIKLIKKNSLDKKKSKIVTDNLWDKEIESKYFSQEKSTIIKNKKHPPSSSLLIQSPKKDKVLETSLNKDIKNKLVKTITKSLTNNKDQSPIKEQTSNLNKISNTNTKPKVKKSNIFK